MRKINIAIGSCAVLLLFVKGFSVFLTTGYGLHGIIVLLGCGTPLVVVYLMSQRARWLGALIGAATWQHALPIVFLNGVEVGILMTLLVAFLVLAHAMQVRRSWLSVFDSWQSRIMGIVGVSILLRVLADPPGSVNVGEIGGAREAGVFLVGAFAFFVPKLLFDSELNMAETRRTALRFALGALLVHFAITFPGGGVGYGFRRLYVRSVWFLCAYALASVGEKSWRRGVDGPRNWTVMGITLLLGSLSAHRSRIVFAVGILGAVSHIYGRLSRNVVFMLSLVFAIGMGLAVTGSELPAPVARPLSILFPKYASKANEYVRAHDLSNEMGWSSPFRGVLLRMAGKSIRRRPFVGRGFTFSPTDYWVAYHKRNTMEGKYQMLAATGAYHNSLVELAVACGLPVAFLFVAVYFNVVAGFVRRLKMEECPDTRVLYCAMLGLFVGESGQFLMNGGSLDFYAVSLLLGVMHYSRIRVHSESSQSDGGELPSSSKQLGVISSTRPFV